MGIANSLEVLINAKDNTAKEFEKFEENLRRIADGFTRTGKKMMLGGLALGAAVGLAVREFQEEEQVVQKLTHVLKTSVDASDEQIESLKKQASALQKTGVVSDTTTMALQAQLGTFMLSADTIKMMTPAILDMVVAEQGVNATTEDMISFGNAFGMAMEGNYAALTRRGFKIDENTKQIIEHGTETEKAAAIVAYLNSVYKGMNEEMRKTSAGGLAALKNGFSDLQESLGEAAAPVLLDFMKQLTEYGEKIINWFKDLSPETKEFIGKMMIMAPLLITVGGGLFYVTGQLMQMGMFLMHANAWWKALGTAGKANMTVLAQTIAVVALTLIGMILLIEMATAAWQTFRAKQGAKKAIAGGAEADEIRRAYDAGEITKEEAMARMKGAQSGISESVRLSSGRTGTEKFQTSEIGRFIHIFADVNVKKEDEIGGKINESLKPLMAGS